MRQSVTMRLDPNVLKAARQKAISDNRTLTNYIETLLRRDLQTTDDEPRLQMIAPDDIRNSTAIPVAGETQEEQKRRDDVFFAIIDSTNH
ncbi:MAG: hypothetical protein ACXW39_09085 [Nitrospira sp.]